MPGLERAWARASGGRHPLSGVLVPSLILHTTGAKSGLERDSPLMYCPEPGGAMLVTGSNFARDTHPAWTANLAAHPDAAVTVRGKRIAVRAARIPDGELDAVIAFARTTISRETAELFKPLALAAKLALLPFLNATFNEGTRVGSAG